MPQTQLNKVGLTYQPPNGSLILDDEEGRMEFRDNKGVITVLVSPESKPVNKATWSEAGKDASLQLYLEGYEDEDNFEVDEEKDENEEGKQENADEDEEKEGDGKKEKRHNGEKVAPKFYRVHGLGTQDQPKIKEFVEKCLKLELGTEPWDARGTNFGNMSVSKAKRCVVLSNFEEEDKHTMEFPLANVFQIAVPGKNEIEIQYTFPASSSSKDATSGKFELSVVRLFVPHQEEDEEPKDEAEVTETWRMRMKEVTDLYDEGDEAALGLICNIDEQWCNFSAPRGKYRVDVYKDMFRMRGKTYDFKILYSTITQMHLLDHPDFVAKFLVISLSTPLRQGQQRYPHLVMTIDDQESELQLIPSEDELASLYPDSGLTQVMKGSMPEVIAKLLKIVASKKVFVMASNGFVAAKEDGMEESSKRDRCVRCAYKANSGFLYPMKHSMVFLHKPVLYIRYDSIATIEFKRSNANSKTFDLAIVLSETPDVGSGLSRSMEFGQIPRKQFDPLSKFFMNETKVEVIKKEELKNLFARDAFGTGPGGRAKGQTILDLGGDDDEEEDEEDSDFDADAIKKTKKKSREGEGEGDEDEDEDDEDESSGGSGSSSDEDESDSDMAEEVPMDADELAIITGTSTEVEGKRKRSAGGEKKKKKAKRDAEGDEGEEKKKKKPKDPNAPKGPKTAYFFFMEKIRPELKAKGIVSVTDVGKQAGELWRALEDKSEYEKLAVQDKERYKKEMESYKPIGGGEASSPVKKKRDPNAPKGAKSAFNFYSDEHRGQLKAEGMTNLGDQSKKLSEMWKALSEADKAKYNEMAAKDKERYTAEMKNYKPPAGLESPAKKKKSSGTKQTKSEAGGEPKKKKAKALGGGELPSDSSSSEDDSSSEDE